MSAFNTSNVESAPELTNLVAKELDAFWPHLARSSRRPRFLLAVSGGRDSLVMLDVLAEVFSRPKTEEAPGFDLGVGHIDHRLRSSSAKDAELVKSVCSKRSLAFHAVALRERPEPGDNLEAWAREQRYAELELIRVQNSYDWLFTAHHISDVAETILWRWLSGRMATAGKGLLQLDAGRKIFRPFWKVDQGLIDDWALRNELSFSEDETNDDLSFTRNFIRKRIGPLIKRRVNDSYELALVETEQRISEDESFLWTLADSRAGSTDSSLELEGFSELDQSLGWRVLEVSARKQLSIGSSQIGYRRLKQLAEQLTSMRVGMEFRFELHGGILASGVGGDYLRFEFNNSANSNERAGFYQKISVPGTWNRSFIYDQEFQLEAVLIRAETSEILGKLEEVLSENHSPLERASAIFDFDLLKVSDLTVRSWSAGDQMSVFRRGNRKVKKLFQERSTPQELRRQLPFVEIESKLIWIPGVARSSDALVTKNTKNALLLSFKLGPSSA